MCKNVFSKKGFCGNPFLMPLTKALLLGLFFTFLGSRTAPIPQLTFQGNRI